jgi:hypothetical protein
MRSSICDLGLQFAMASRDVGGIWRRLGCAEGSASGGSRRPAGRTALGGGRGVPRVTCLGCWPRSCRSVRCGADPRRRSRSRPFDRCRAAGALHAPGQHHGLAADAPGFGQAIKAGVAIDLQGPGKAAQDVHRMRSTAPGRIGEGDRRGIAAPPTTIIPRQCPEITGLGLARLRVQHRGAGLFLEEPG